jgi:PLP dependent protein
MDAPAHGAASAGSEREAELVGSVAAVRSRIADACRAAGRDPKTVTLIAVTKTWPAGDVAALVRAGVRDVGENRDQEAVAKVAAVAALLALPGGRAAIGEAPDAPRWHFVGQLQRRKARSVAGYATAVHSVDRPELAAALADGVRRAARGPLEVFLQVSLDGDPSRGGVAPDGLLALADRVADAPELRLVGVMAVAPMSSDPAGAFASLAAHAAQLREQHPGATGISAGMSDDFEQALRHGATHVRIGSALLGSRQPQIG